MRNLECGDLSPLWFNQMRAAGGDFRPMTKPAVTKRVASQRNLECGDLSPLWFNQMRAASRWIPPADDQAGSNQANR
jgi:hypothetical protein